MKKLSVIALACLLLVGCGPGYVKTPAPSPTPGLDASIIIAQAIATSVGAGTYASLADTNESHPTPTPAPTMAPSEAERIAGRVAWPISLAVLAVCFLSLAVIGGLTLNTADRRRAEMERQRLAVEVATGQIPELKAVLESLIAYQQGADVPPRNKGEIENE